MTIYDIKIKIQNKNFLYFSSGYYRVNYDPENWMALAEVLDEAHETIDLLNRAQIIDDSFNLARNGRLVGNLYKIIS